MHRIGMCPVQHGGTSHTMHTTLMFQIFVVSVVLLWFFDACFSCQSFGDVSP